MLSKNAEDEKRSVGHGGNGETRGGGMGRRGREFRVVQGNFRKHGSGLVTRNIVWGDRFRLSGNHAVTVRSDTGGVVEGKFSVGNGRGDRELKKEEGRSGSAQNQRGV